MVDLTPFFSLLTSDGTVSIVRARLPNSTTLDLRLRECMRFLYLVSTRNDSSFIPLAPEVDEVWHELILQTRAYARLCDTLPGQRFIHHSSQNLETYSSTRNRRAVVSEMLSWLPQYVAAFGLFEKEIQEYWTLIKYLRAEFNMDLGQINALAKQGNAAVLQSNHPATTG